MAARIALYFVTLHSKHTRTCNLTSDLAKIIVTVRMTMPFFFPFVPTAQSLWLILGCYHVLDHSRKSLCSTSCISGNVRPVSCHLKPMLVKNWDNTTTCRQHKKVLFPPNMRGRKIQKSVNIIYVLDGGASIILFLFSCISFLQNIIFNQFVLLTSVTALFSFHIWRKSISFKNV